jgi:hypothetical protein
MVVRCNLKSKAVMPIEKARKNLLAADYLIYAPSKAIHYCSFLMFWANLGAASRRRRCAEPLKAKHRLDPLFCLAMILLDHIVQILGRVDRGRI